MLDFFSISRCPNTERERGEKRFEPRRPDGTFKLTSVTHLQFQKKKKIVTLTRCSSAHIESPVSRLNLLGSRKLKKSRRV